MNFILQIVTNYVTRLSFAVSRMRWKFLPENMASSNETKYLLSFHSKVRMH